jgi:hypothetical protein
MSTHLEFHKSKINSLIRFCHDNNIYSFAYGYKQKEPAPHPEMYKKEEFSDREYWEVIEYFQQQVNCDNNIDYIFFYVEDSQKRQNYLAKLDSKSSESKE